MDGSAVGEQPSEKKRTYTEIFEEAFPVYLAYGMTYDQFWKEDPCLAKAYRKAHEIKLQMDNSRAWQQGAYFYHALCAASPLFRFSMEKVIYPMPYLDEPFKMKGNDSKDEEEEISPEDAQALVYLTNFAKVHNKKMEEKQCRMS